MKPRKVIKITAFPDPLTQERLEDVGFFFDEGLHAWIKFCDESEQKMITDWVRRQLLPLEALPADGRGQLKKHPRLSDELVKRNGGTPDTCALCGATGTPCRQWIEGDDTDSIDYPNPARFYMCGKCVQTRMQPHPRMYAPAEDTL